MKTLAVYSVKGGVGKTASSVNLAYLAARDGLRTLLWDLDPQAASTFYLRVRPQGGGGRAILRGERRLRALIKASDYTGLDVLPARFSFRRADATLEAGDDALQRFAHLIAPLREHYDLLLFDCPPGLTVTAESVLHAASAVLVPVIPTPLSLRTLQMLHDHLQAHPRRAPPVWPYLAMVDRRRALHRSVCDQPQALAYAPLRTCIPYASVVERMGLERQPLGAFAAGSEAGRAYRALWDEVHARLQE